MRVEADAGIGELGHVGAPQHHQPHGLEAGDGGGIEDGGRGIGEDGGAGARHFAGLVEQVLHRKRDTGIGRGGPPALSERVHALGRRQHAVVVDGEEGSGAFAFGVADFRQCRLGQGPRAGAPGAEVFGQPVEPGKQFTHDLLLKK